MGKVIVIASIEDIDKSPLLYEILENEFKNKRKGFIFSFKKNVKYGDYVFTDKKSFLDIINFIKNKNIDFIVLDYFQYFNKKGIKEFKELIELIELIREKHINVYIISKLRKKLSLNQEPKIWHLDILLRNIVKDEVIFLYLQNNKLTKKILDKEQIKEEKKQVPSLDRGLFGKLIRKEWIE